MLEFDKNCTIIVKSSKTVWQQINALQKNLEKSDTNAKVDALQEIILGMVHGEQYSKLLMPVIKFAVPSGDHRVKKLTQIFFEIVDKCHPDGTLKEEMILLCNALRNDLMSPNEYVRGSTLRLLCKMRHIKIVEPLLGAILANLKSKHPYVRKNAVMCVFSIAKNFGLDVIPTALDKVGELLLTEDDVCTRRNAFLMLLHSDVDRAMEYVARVHVSVAGMGDIFQLVLIELVKKVCRQNPQRKSSLIRLVMNLLETAPPAVTYEGASSLVMLSGSPIALKAASETFVKLLLNQADNTVKLIVLDKLMHIMKQHRHVVEESVGDIMRALNFQSLAIRKRTIEIVLFLTSRRTLNDVITVLKKEVLKTLEVENKTIAETKEYRRLLIRSIHAICTRHSESAASIIDMLMDLLVENDQRVTTEVVILVREIAATNTELVPTILRRIISFFSSMQQSRVIRVCLWIIGEYCTSNHLIEELVDKIYNCLIPLKPITERLEGGTEADRRSASDTEGSAGHSPKTRLTTRTVILEDGTYGTEDIVIEDGGDTAGPSNLKYNASTQEPLKNIITSGDFLVCAVLAVSLTKIALKMCVEPQETADDTTPMLCNKITHIVASLLRFVKLHPSGGVKCDSFVRINQCFKAVTSLMASPSSAETAQYRKLWFPDGAAALSKVLAIEVAENEAALMLSSDEMEEATITEPDEQLVFRQLRERRAPALDILDDGELDVRAAVGAESSSRDDAQLFQKRLQKFQQITGFSDPIYIEAFIQVLEFDLLVEFTVTNRLSETLQNVTMEIFTHGDMKLVDRPASCTLMAGQTIRLYASIKVQSMDAGILFGYVTYDRSGAREAEVLVLNELHVDVLEYIKQSWIGELSFRSMWSEFEWENKLNINTVVTSVEEFLAYLIQHTGMTVVGKYPHPSNMKEKADGGYHGSQQNNEADVLETVKAILRQKHLTEQSHIFAINLYCKNIFGEDALANVSIEKLRDGKLAGTVRIRSRTQGVALSLGDRMTLLQRGMVLTNGAVY